MENNKIEDYKKALSDYKNKFKKSYNTFASECDGIENMTKDIIDRIKSNNPQEIKKDVLY